MRRTAIARVLGVVLVILVAGGAILAARPTAPPAAPSPSTPPAASAEPSPSIARFGPNGTQEAFDALLGDPSIDVIEMAAGTYRGWHLRFVHSRASRPLLVRPAPNADVVWDDAGGTSGDALFYVGWGEGFRPADTVTNGIRFDPAGTGGTFTIQNYSLGKQGLISTFWVDDVAFNGFRTHDIGGVEPGWLSWQAYVSSDGVHPSGSVTFNDWVVAASEDRLVGGLQTGNDPQAASVTALRWRITGAKSAMTLYGSATGIRIEGWVIADCDYAVTSDGNAGGVLAGNISTGSANPPIIRAPLVDGGGNSWH